MEMEKYQELWKGLAWLRLMGHLRGSTSRVTTLILVTSYSLLIITCYASLIPIAIFISFLLKGILHQINKSTVVIVEGIWSTISTIQVHFKVYVDMKHSQNTKKNGQFRLAVSPPGFSRATLMGVGPMKYTSDGPSIGHHSCPTYINRILTEYGDISPQYRVYHLSTLLCNISLLSNYSKVRWPLAAFDTIKKSMCRHSYIQKILFKLKKN